MRKRRILMVNEAPWLNTGYAVYGKELFERLSATGKYELAMLGQYADPSDNRISQYPYKIYGNLPVGHHSGQAKPEEVQAYESNQLNEFGTWKFESVCLDFQPDIVCSIQDTWYFEFQERSPFRRFYKWVVMPTVDSLPQLEDWISLFINADAILTYTDWSKKVLDEQSNEMINTKGSAPPAADSCFFPVLNRREHKQRFGFDPDTFIVGTNMRCQKRKLFPDLFEAFGEFCKQNVELAKKTILLCHTSYPDLGWDIPRLLNMFGISHKVYFTYLCHNCHLVFPQPYRDVRSICPKCHSNNASLPNTQAGVDRKAVAAITNLFDIFVQFSIAEAYGLPQCEAAACSVPVMSVDYSGMSDIVHQLKGYPIKVQRFFYECETGCKRALPDNQDFIDKLKHFLELPESMKNKKRMETRKLYEKYYSWDESATKWIQVFDSFEAPMENPWKSPPHLHSPAQQIPSREQLDDANFVSWAIVNILGQPSRLNSYMATRMLRDLTWEAHIPGFGGYLFNDLSYMGLKPKYQRFTRDECAAKLRDMCQFNNHWEQIRVQMVMQGAIK